MYEDTSYEVILNRMLSRIPDKFDKREGSVIWDTHSPTAIELQILYIELDNILKEAYGDTATREFLIRRCRERGIYPYAATRAVLKGVFVPAQIDVSGQRFGIDDVRYTVTEKISDGEYRVECETSGQTGNQFLGTMVPVTYIQGLKSAELTELLIPGEDEEDTEALRQRYFDSFNEKSFGGNMADYLEKTNSISGVGKTKVTRIWNGDISPAAMVPSETVKSWYENTVGTLDQETADWLTSVYSAAAERKLTTGGTILLTIIDAVFNPASDALVKTVQETIDPAESAGEGYGIAPIGHVVQVKSAEGIEVVIKTDLDFETGYGWDGLKDSVETSISDYLLELRKSWADLPHLTVRASQIERRILDIQGVVDVRNTLINGTASNLVMGRYEVPLFGGVIV